MDNLVVFSEDGVELEVSVTPEQDTVWLTQAQMANLYDTTPQNITLHIRNLYKEDELNREATCKDFLQVQLEGNRTVSRKQKNCSYLLRGIAAVGAKREGRLLDILLLKPQYWTSSTTLTD